MAKTTILDIINGPMPLAGIKGASPAAKHVAEHVQDPLGATKDGFSKLGEKQLEYESAKQDMVRQLAPVKSVIQHVEQLHGLPQLNPTGEEEMDPNDPNNIDPETGLPYPPGQNPNNPQMGAVPGTGQVPGAVNKNNPAQNVGQPGTGPKIAPGRSPAPKESVRPQKLGQASPGASGTPGYPQPNTGVGRQQYPGGKPAAAKPPQGKKPATAKKSAPADKSAREIKVHVSAGASPAVVSGAMTLRASLDYADLSAMPKELHAAGRKHMKDCLCSKCTKGMKAKGKKSKK